MNEMGEIKHHRFTFYAYLFKEKRTERWQTIDIFHYLLKWGKRAEKINI